MSQLLIIPLIFIYFAISPALGLNGNPQGPKKEGPALYVGELNHTAVSCAGLLERRMPGGMLGDFRYFVDRGEPVYFRSALPAAGGVHAVEVEYETEIHRVEDRDDGFRQVVRGLVARSTVRGTEQEVGALSFVGEGKRITVYFSSRAHHRIAPRHHRLAMDRFLDRVYSRLRVWQWQHGDIPTDFSIERFHSHPSDVNLPHSARDVMQDSQFDSWMRQESPLLVNLRFRSYVVPLFYHGELFVEFEPRRHRLF